jgi:phytol kinase
MNGMLLAAAGTAAILLTGEWLWRKHILKGEFARKFVHITAASFAAFWPLFMGRISIALLSLIFVAALIIIKQLHIFKSLHSVQRATYGEIWYAISIGIIALVFKDDVIYAIAILHMALADGFAAVVGAGLAKRAKNFHFRGCRKSIEGSLTFLVISFLLNLSYWTIATHYPINFSGIYLSPVLYSLLSAGLLTGTEIVAPKGSDNVLVPLLSGALLWVPTILLASAILT